VYVLIEKFKLTFSAYCNKFCILRWRTIQIEINATSTALRTIDFFTRFPTLAYSTIIVVHIGFDTVGTPQGDALVEFGLTLPGHFRYHSSYKLKPNQKNSDSRVFWSFDKNGEK